MFRTAPKFLNMDTFRTNFAKGGEFSKGGCKYAAMLYNAYKQKEYFNNLVDNIKQGVNQGVKQDVKNNYSSCIRYFLILLIQVLLIFLDWSEEVVYVIPFNVSGFSCKSHIRSISVLYFSIITFA